MIYKKHVFICENSRGSSSRKSCGSAGVLIRTKLKKEIVEKGLNKEIRINKSGCLGKCNKGPCVVVYPKQKWYFNTELDQCKKIINELTSK